MAHNGYAEELASLGFVHIKLGGFDWRSCDDWHLYGR
jgi:hypothetical protein